MTGARLNCWEYQRCGREQGGANIEDSAPCPASTLSAHDGVHQGSAGGRVCWTIPGTQCEGCGHNTLAEKRAYCSKCSFYNRVFVEQGPEFDDSTIIQPPTQPAQG